MQAPDIVQQFRVWGQEFDPCSPGLAINDHPMTWQHVRSFLRAARVTQVYFIDSFCGGAIHKTALNKTTKGRLPLAIKAIILMACKYRFHLLESSPHRYSRRAG